MKPRRITPIDRLLAWADRAEAAAGEAPKARRRTHHRAGKLDVVIVERTGEPTIVYVSEGDEPSPVIIQASAADLIEAAAFVREAIGRPPPVKRRP
jgi:hypothetical protein